MMKTYGKATAIVVLTFILSGPVLPAHAGEEAKEDKPTVNLSVDVLSQYLWRGYALSSDSAVLQPSATVSYKGFSLNLWGNFDTDEALPNKGARWNETDFTFSYARELFKGFNATVGGTYYSLVNSRYDSVEVFGGVSYAFPWVTVGVTGYREVSHSPGWWVQMDLSKNFPLPCYGLSLDLGASLGYLVLEDSNYSEFHAGQVFGALNIPLGKYFTVSPRVGVSFPLSDGARREIETVSWDGEDTHVFGGIRLSAAF